MRLSTSTNIVSVRPDGRKLSIPQTLELASQAGFDRFDLCFYDWSTPDADFLTDRWEHWIHEAAEAAERLGVSFGQCHAYSYDFLNPRYTEEERAHHEMLLRRSLRCCAALGSKLCVVHPDTDFSAERPIASSRERNLTYFKRLLDDAAAIGVELAIENMIDYTILPKRKFFVTPEEIADFIDSFADDRIGVCWDFEHGDIQEFDQPAAVHLLGKRLKATHVSDAASKTYEPLMHVMPFFGFADWGAIVRALHEIGYDGDFSFEAHNYANRMPDELLLPSLRFSHQIGQYLLSLSS